MSVVLPRSASHSTSLCILLVTTLLFSSMVDICSCGYFLIPPVHSLPNANEYTDFSDPTVISASNLRDERFWTALSPDLHIYDKDFAARQDYFHPSVVDAVRVSKLVNEEGYAQLDPLPWDLPLASMVALIEKLHTLGLPITFCYLFDEFWFIFMRLHGTLGHILGSEYRRLPDFWAWRVDPRNDERGWNVHRDKSYETLFVNGAPKTLSIWIPLTDATTSNGCMYVLPADRDPTYRKNDTLGHYWEKIAPDIRALPVPAGGVLVWNQMVWHWGSRSNKRGTQPRYSLAVEFQAAPTRHLVNPTHPVDLSSDSSSIIGTSSNDQSEVIDAYYTTSRYGLHSDAYGNTVPVYNAPLSHPLLLHKFQDRLKLVAKQLLQYKHMYPLSKEMQQLAEDLL